MFEWPWYVWAGIGALLAGIGWLFWEAAHPSTFDEDVYLRKQREGKR